MREYVTFAAERDARDYAAFQDKLHGYPQRNVRVDGRPGTSFTERYADVRKHPSRDEWAVEATDTPARLSKDDARSGKDRRLKTAERSKIVLELAKRKQLEDDWESKPERVEAKPGGDRDAKPLAGRG